MQTIITKRLAMYNCANYATAYHAAKESALYSLSDGLITLTHENADDVLGMVFVANRAVECTGNPECFMVVFCNDDGSDATPASAFILDYMEKND